MLARPDPKAIETGPFTGLLRSHYSVIAADPGTEFKARSPKGETARTPQKKYTTMPLAEIAAMPVGELAAADCFLFFWTTTPLIAVGAHIPIMAAWGFKPTAVAFCWVKTRMREAPALFLNAKDSFHFGAGFTTRKNVEICVLGRKGKPVRRSKSVRELLIAPRREHSRKPEEAIERMQAYAAGPYLELFARAERPGWTCWGDEVGKFNAALTKEPA